MINSVTIEDTLRRLNRNMQLWKGNPINIYNTALTNAHNNFQKTIADQQKTDNLQAEVLFLIGFVVAGSLLTGVTTAAGAYFAKKAVSGRFSRLISRPKMLDFVNGITTFSNTGIGSSLRQQLASEIKTFGKVKGSAQAQSLNNLTNVAAIQPRTVADIKSVLLLDLTDTFQELYDLAVQIDKTSVLTGAEKNECASWLMRHPFMVADVPDIRTHQRSMEVVIELTFLLNHILTMDRLVTTEYFMIHTPQIDTIETYSTSVPITGSYRQGTYPVPKDGPGRGDSFGTEQKIAYSDPGNTIAKRINELLAKSPIAAGKPDFMVDDSWFTNEMGKAQIVKAENYLVELMNVETVKAASSFQ